MGFNPELEVPSLELCKKLKELGLPQEGGGWYWKRKISSEIEYELVFIKRFPKHCPLFEFPLDPDEFKGECCIGGECKKGISIGDWIRCEENPLIKSFTSRELKEWLPVFVITYRNFDGKVIVKDLDAPNRNYTEAFIPIFKADTEANACAKMLIWLLRNKHIKFKK